MAASVIAGFFILALTRRNESLHRDKRKWSARIRGSTFTTVCFGLESCVDACKEAANASSGYLHRATPIQHGNMQVDVAVESKEDTLGWEEQCRGTAARQWIITAPLGPPTHQTVRYAMLELWTLLVVELEDTPQTWRQEFDKLWDESAAAGAGGLPNIVFLDRHAQQELGFASGGCNDSHSRSRNIGSLFAIVCGAEVIVEAEEGVELIKAAAQPPVQAADSGPFPQALGDPSSRLINPYALFGHPDIWPRGFPLAAISNATFEFRRVQQPPNQGPHYKPLIQSILVDEHPATDAVLGLTELAHKGPQHFYSKPDAIAVEPGYFAPLPLGSMAYLKGGFWGLALNAAPNEALAPAWRSLWVQKLLWKLRGQMLLVAPSVRQNKSSHATHLEALEQEMQGHGSTVALVEFLHQWGSDELLLHLRMLHLARDLREAGFWSQAEVDSMAAWVADLRTVGYVFPEVHDIEKKPESNAENPRKKRKLAAFCFTGQADRAPEAIPGTLSLMQMLLTADSSLQKALVETLEHTRDNNGSIVFAHDSFAYVSSYESCGDHIRWVAQHPFTYSVLYNDPLLEVPYPLDPARFGGNAIVPMLYQMHAQQRCYEMVQDYSRQYNVEYSVIVRLRTDHQLQSLAVDNSTFALWSELSQAAVIIPQPEWDFSDIMPATGGGYQDRIGWGPARYMGIYMSRWSQFFNRTHMESDAPFHGESSLRYALTTAGIPVERLSDDQLQYLEVPHSELKCAIQEARRTYV